MMAPPAYGIDAYRQVASLAVLDQVEEVAVIAAARAGDQAARDRLVTHCMLRALPRALGLARFYQALLGVELDPQDIAQEACLRALVRLDKALAASSPIGYLRRAIEGAMLTWCRERQSAVRVPVTTQWRGVRPVKVISLDQLGELAGEVAL